MRIICKHLTIIFLLLFPLYVKATTVTTSNCRYMGNQFKNSEYGLPEIINLDTMYYCPVDDKKTSLKEVQFVLTKPIQTQNGVCYTKKYNITPKHQLRKLKGELLWAIPLNFSCPSIAKGNYISLEYIPVNYDPETFMIKMSLLLKKINIGSESVFDIPFYNLWFCNICDRFINHFKSKKIIIRRVSSSMENKNLSIIISSEVLPENRWILFLSNKKGELTIKKVRQEIN